MESYSMNSFLSAFFHSAWLFCDSSVPLLGINISFPFAFQSTVWIYHSSYIHSPFNGHRGCTQIGAVMNKVAMYVTWLSQAALVVKCLPANMGECKWHGSIPGSGRSPGGRRDNLLQYSCLENPMDREAWQAMVHRVAKSRIWLKRLSMHACTFHAWVSVWTKAFISLG